MPQKDPVLTSVRLRVGFQKMVSTNVAVLSEIHPEAPCERSVRPALRSLPAKS